MFSDLLLSLKQQIESLNSKYVHTTKSAYVTLSAEIKPRLTLNPVSNNHSFFWSKPSELLTLMGCGSLINVKTHGHERFVSLKQHYNQLLNQWSGEELPCAFIVFAFDADDPMQGCWDKLPNTLLTIPEFVIEDKRHHQRLIINLHINQTDIDELFHKIANTLGRLTEPEPGIQIQPDEPVNAAALVQASSKNREKWLQLTRKAIRDIQSGPLEKLVTSRQINVNTDRPIDVSHLLRQLICCYPTCSIFSYQTQGKTMLAASPERLLSLNNRYIRSDAIGGTLSHAPESLLKLSANESKLLNEHAIIAEDIYRRLDPYCHVLKMPLNPLLMKLHNMYHLETPVSGQLREQKNIFDIIDTLHPTPAIAGYPAEQAQQWLIQNECYNRGWYTGACGWIRGTEQGELSVLLRCALIEANQACLFAGAGLVAESVAEQEWQETELKINTILNML